MASDHRGDQPTGESTVDPSINNRSHESTTSASAPYRGLGSLIRMRALKASELPLHPALANAQEGVSPPQPRDFLSNVIEEALGFMTQYLPKNFESKSTSKQSPPSAAPVELLTHTISINDIPKDARVSGSRASKEENWFARTSIHENAAKAGTATWEEFDGGLRVNHSQHEMDYTPDVYDAHEVLNWSEQLGDGQSHVGEWSEVSMCIMEMVHKIPTPLYDRVFPVLVVTGKKAKEFLVVQIPVGTSNLSAPKYHNVPRVTGGVYCSIEYGQLMDEDTRVKWQMATASDARGNIPMWMQKMGVPGAVVKDVGLFIGWCEKKREGTA